MEVRPDNFRRSSRLAAVRQNALRDDDAASRATHPGGRVDGEDTARRSDAVLPGMLPAAPDSVNVHGEPRLDLHQRGHQIAGQLQPEVDRPPIGLLQRVGDSPLFRGFRRSGGRASRTLR
ncbi:hypothetical protein QAD02_002396 [Eretmocerus hayati]|uniref:Uncharacterized protein n=1 Tax=Eretmocerus hayati TaxID=131215 RepID=A0ACC2NJ66_9HYME|nr:hypothetical protein QAD02_002396 [Eretmocerus hayati]